MIALQAYLKANNTGTNDYFGFSVAVSGDTAVIGAFQEDSNATGVGGDQANNSAVNSGAAYVFVRNGSTWTQQAYLKASNTEAGDYFGWSVAVSGDTAVIGAYQEDSNATTVNGDGSNNSASNSGAAYVFTRSGSTWTQQAYLKASNTEANDIFGASVAVSGDTVVIGASWEASNATGVDGDQANNSALLSGAAYVFVRNASTWTQQAYLKASNTGATDSFGGSVAVSGDTAVIGAMNESSNATGVGGDQANNSAVASGAAYVFTRSGSSWTQQAYLKASNAEAADNFGISVAISGDTVVIGAYQEASNATGVGGDQANNSALLSGAAYVFVRNASTWTQQAYLKASNSAQFDTFGYSVAVSGDTAMIGASSEASNATGVDGDQTNNSASGSGAAYVFIRSGSTWTQQAYLKASNSGANDLFGRSVAVSDRTMVSGAYYEDSNATGVGGDQSDNSASDSGAAYIFTDLGPAVATPTVSLVTPATGSTAGGTTVTISGTDFTGATDVTFGGTAATSFTVDSATQITATTPAGSAGAVSVLVTTPGGTNVANTLFTYVSAPEIALSGNSVDIAMADVTPDLADHTGFGSTSVSGGSVARTFTITNSGTAVLALSGTPDLVTLSGAGASHFSVTTQPASATVSLGGGTQTFVVTYDPSAVGTHTATVSIASNDADENPFTFDIQGTGVIPAPTVVTVTPATGSTAGGTAVTITGTDLTGATDVTFGGVAAASFTVDSATQITATTPAGSAGTVSVLVTTPSGTNAANTLFTYVVPGPLAALEAYLKAGNSGVSDSLGLSVAVSGDIAVIGAPGEDSNASTVNGDGSNNSASNSGAAYVFTRSGGTWSQQAYLKASNSGGGDNFGYSVAVSGDTVVIGAYQEDSNATTVNGDGSNNSASNSGAAYVFTRSGGVWSQQAYLKAINSGADDNFGLSVAVSGDTVVIGAYQEDSNATTVNGDGSDNSATNSGAAYVFTRSGGVWSQQAYLKANNSEGSDNFGFSVAVSGNAAVIGAIGEDSNATTVNGDGTDNSASGSGAAYVFIRSGGVWSQQTYLKATNAGIADAFGFSVAVSGATAVIGATQEDSNATTVNGDGSDNSASNSGAAYVFTRSGSVWSQQAYLKANNADAGDQFGFSVAVSGNTAVIGAYQEDSNATTVNGDGSDNSAASSGAAYAFTRSGSVWSQQAYLKAGNAGVSDQFGYSAALSGDTVVIGATQEDSNATTVNGNGSNNSAIGSGAAYVFTGLGQAVAAPTVSLVTPASGSTAGGTTVTITGTEFTEATDVTFGGTAATSFTVDSATQITATTPAHAAGAVSVLVTTPGGTNVANTLFTYAIPVTPPVITDEPDGGSFPVYSSVTLSVVATGTATLNYQWSKDGTEIQGATNADYTVASLTRETAGSYTVVVTNDYGSDTSAAAVLQVAARELLNSDETLPLPGFPGASLYRPLTGVIGPDGSFVINAMASVGAGGITSGNDQVILTNVSGSLQAIGQEGQSVGSGTMSRLFYYMNAADNSTAHYRAAVNGTSSLSDTAYFISPDGQSLEVLSQEGDEAPEGGITFSSHISPPAISQTGIVYFDSQLTGTGITTKNDSGVWYDDEGEQGTLAREGERAPTGSSVDDQAWYSQILAGSVVAGAESASFIAELQADPTNAANKTSGLRNIAIFTGTPGNVSTVVRKADVIDGLQVRGFNSVSASRDGGHAFVSNLTQGGSVTSANAMALFYKPASGPAVLVAQKGQSLPDTGVISVFERLFAAAEGQVIFEVTLTNASTSDNALCRWTAAGGLEVLMQEGDAAPGGGLFGPLRSIAVSGQGNLLLQDSRAVWRDTGAGLQMVLKVGDTVTYAGLPKTVLALAINDETANTRRAGGGFGGMINDDGAVLVIASVGGGDYTLQIFP